MSSKKLWNVRSAIPEKLMIPCCTFSIFGNMSWRIPWMRIRKTKMNRYSISLF